MGDNGVEKPVAQIQIVFTSLFRRYSYAEMPCEPCGVRTSVVKSKGRARRKWTCALDAPILCVEI